MLTAGQGQLAGVWVGSRGGLLGRFANVYLSAGADQADNRKG